MTAAIYLITAAALLTAAKLLERHVKKHHPELWEELNKYGD